MAIPYGHHGLLLGASAGGSTPVAGAKTILNFNGADGSTTIVDDTGNHTWTTAVNAQIDTAQSKFGGSSLLINTSGDRITAPSHADWAFGTGDFTVAGWVRQNSGDQASDRILFIVNTNNGCIILLRGGQLTLGYEGVAYDHQASFTNSPDTWYHWEVGRSGSTAYGFINGTQVFTGANTRNFAQAAASFGAKTSGIGSMHMGWLDSCVVVKGTCLHTANFTPPAGPYAP